MSLAAKPADKPARSNKRAGPSPSHTLLTAIRSAVGVEPTKIVPALDFARSAEGASQAHGAVANKSSRDKARRVAARRQELAEQGWSSGPGKRMFGYRPD